MRRPVVVRSESLASMKRDARFSGEEAFVWAATTDGGDLGGYLGTAKR
jgi:hypothetical protein